MLLSMRGPRPYSNEPGNGPRRGSAPVRLAAACLALVLAACGAEPSGPRTVVLISLDTLRPERLGVYGGEEGVSPRLDALAAEAVVFDDALSVSSWTLPAHMSMLTGMNPVAHGVVRGDMVLSSKVETLAERLKADGFATAGFTDGGYVDSAFGFDHGFDVFEDERTSGGPNGFTRLLPPALDWLGERSPEEDVFLFLHTFDPHAPFDEAPADVRERFRSRPVAEHEKDAELFNTRFLHQQRKMGVPEYARMGELLNDYDSGVFTADRGVGEVLDLLERLGRYDDALVVVTSDHGESFLDHRVWVGHGIGLLDDEIAIPMMVKFPGGVGGGMRIDALVDLLDVVPTVLDVLGLEIDRDLVEGESLLGLARGERRRRSWVFGGTVNSETYFLVRDGYKYVTPLGIPPMLVARRHIGPTTPEVLEELVRGSPYKIGHGDAATTLRYNERRDPLGIRDVLRVEEQLYSRADDPGERVNVARAEPAIARRLSEDLRKILVRSESVADRLREVGVEKPRNPHAEHQLAQLGYLASNSSDDLSKMPKAMRDALANPYEPPDVEVLLEADRTVHRLRLLHMDGALLPEDAAATLQRAGDALLAWARANTKHRTRCQWRLIEIRDLAAATGLSIQVGKWRPLMKEVASAKKKQEKDAESGAGERAEGQEEDGR